MMERMKIMIIEKNLSGGGAEHVATNLATCLSKTEDVILVVFNAKNNTYGSTVRTIDLHMPESKGKMKLLWHLKARNKVAKIKKEFGITHAISFMAEPDLANVMSRGTEKVIISVRNKHSSSSPTKLHFMKNAWVFKQADAIVAISKMVKKDLVDAFGVDEQRITPIYNPCYIDTINSKIQENVFTDKEKNFFRVNKGKIVITAGRLEPQKGQWHLIRAFKKVVSSVPNAKLIILGQGTEKKYLETLIKELHLDNNIKMLGYKANPYPYIAYSDLFAFTSVFEGLGNILVECMACKLPVVSSDYPYGAKELLAPTEKFDEFVQDIEFAEFGILVPPMSKKKYTATDSLDKSEEYMADAIIRLLQDDELRNEYRKRIEKRGNDFAPDAITEQWLSVLRNIK